MKAIKLVDICQALIEETITKQGCRQSHDLIIIWTKTFLSLDQLLADFMEKQKQKTKRTNMLWCYLLM